jgi:hypothetical protein
MLGSTKAQNTLRPNAVIRESTDIKFQISNFFPAWNIFLSHSRFPGWPTFENQNVERMIFSDKKEMLKNYFRTKSEFKGKLT